MCVISRKVATATIVLLCFLLTTAASLPEKEDLILPEGTPIKVIVTGEITSKEAKVTIRNARLKRSRS